MTEFIPFFISPMYGFHHTAIADMFSSTLVFVVARLVARVVVYHCAVIHDWTSPGISAVCVAAAVNSAACHAVSQVTHTVYARAGSI